MTTFNGNEIAQVCNLIGAMGGLRGEVRYQRLSFSGRWGWVWVAL